MQTAITIPANIFGQPNEGDELFEQLTEWAGQPAADHLTPLELAAGCRLYAVRNSELSPALRGGEAVLAWPLPADAWSLVPAGAHCLLCVEAPAAYGDPTFLYHTFARVTANALADAGSLTIVDDDADCERVAYEQPGAELREVWRLTRTIQVL